MKRHSILAALAITLLSPLAAYAENYAGASIGRSEHKFDWTDDDASATSFKLYGGHNFTRNFGVEAGYAAHGKWSMTNGDFGASTRVASLYVAATATLPVTEQFSLTGKLGVADNRMKYRNSHAGQAGYTSPTYTRTHAMAGIGASYAFAPGLAGVVEYEHFGKTSTGGGNHMKVHSLSLGLRKSF